MHPSTDTDHQADLDPDSWLHDTDLGIPANFTPPSGNPNYTLPGYPTETDACTALDELTTLTGAFHIHREVRGTYIQPRIGTPTKTPRIDRVLWPTDDARRQGWTLGPIGIECKRSDEKIGPPINQMLDYSRAVWDLPEVSLVLRWVFLWPYGECYGPLASVMNQNRLGGASEGPEGQLRLTTSNHTLADIHPDGRIQCRTTAGIYGSKAGAR